MKVEENISKKPFKNAIAIFIIYFFILLLVLPGGEFTIFYIGTWLILFGIIAISILSIRGIIQLIKGANHSNKIKFYISIFGNSLGLLPILSIIYLIIK